MAMHTPDLLPRVRSMRRATLHNYGMAGLSSSILGGEGQGMVRLFESDRNSEQRITPHSHRFDFTCLVLAGSVKNTIYDRLPQYHRPDHGAIGDADQYVESLLTPVAGGLGKYEAVPQAEPRWFQRRTMTFSAGQLYAMKAQEIHSIRFSRGAAVLFFEGPPVLDTSSILEPWSNGQRVPTFKTEAWMFASDNA